MADIDTRSGSARDNGLLARARHGAAMRRAMVDLIARKTSTLADEPLPLHKGIYTDEGRHQAEVRDLFHRQPLVAGLSGDIPEPGDTLVFDAAGPSILVTRGRDGVARAFLNLCTHRATRLVDEAEPWSGRRLRIVCPFHGWTFDSAGALVGQPNAPAFADCVDGARDLIAVPCAEAAGLLLVRADPEGKPINAAAHLGPIADVLTLLELKRAVPVKKGVLRADANWKYALDTYGEGYHFQTLHRSTIGQTHVNDVALVEGFGRHHRVGFPDRSLIELANRDEAGWPDADYGAVHYLFPNSILFFGSLTPGVFFTQLFRLFPDGPAAMRCHFAVYAPFGIDDEAHRAACEAAFDATATVVQDEDYRVAARAQANLIHAPDDFHLVLGRNEAALQRVHRHLADAIGLPLTAHSGDTHGRH